MYSVFVVILYFDWFLYLVQTALSSCLLGRFYTQNYINKIFIKLTFLVSQKQNKTPIFLTLRVKILWKMVVILEILTIL